MTEQNIPAADPSRPIGARTPLSHETIEHQCMKVDAAHLDSAPTAFFKGVRFAEQAHGIAAPVPQLSEDEILRLWREGDPEANPESDADVVRKVHALLAHVFREKLVGLDVQRELSEAIDDVTDWLDHEGYAEADIRPSLKRLNSARLRLLVATRRRSARPTDGSTDNNTAQEQPHG